MLDLTEFKDAKLTKYVVATTSGFLDHFGNISLWGDKAYLKRIAEELDGEGSLCVTGYLCSGELSMTAGERRTMDVLYQRQPGGDLLQGESLGAFLLYALIKEDLAYNYPSNRVPLGENWSSLCDYIKEHDLDCYWHYRSTTYLPALNCMVDWKPTEDIVCADDYWQESLAKTRDIIDNLAIIEFIQPIAENLGDI